MAEKRRNYIRTKVANAQNSSNFNKNTIPFEFQQNEHEIQHKAGTVSVIYTIGDNISIKLLTSYQCLPFNKYNSINLKSFFIYLN